MKKYICHNCGYEEEFVHIDGLPLCPNCETEMYVDV